MSALDHKRTSHQVRAMSALPPKADMVQHDRDVRFVPKADIARLTQSPRQPTAKGLAYRETESFGRLEIDDKLEFVGRLHRQITRQFTFEDAINIGTRTPKDIGSIGPVGHQTSVKGKPPVWS